MATRVKAFGQVWTPTGAGILIPAGTVLDVSRRSSTTFLDLKAKAEEIEQIYASAKVAIPKVSDLWRLIRNAKLLSDRWLLNRTADATMFDVFDAMHLQRIVEAVLPLRHVSGNKPYLRRLVAGGLDLFKRTKSRAKDALWELEFWSLLRRRSANPRLVDPPDIVVDVGSSAIGISCKKLYSEAHVQNVLSKAVRQVEPYFDIGVVAISLDDLIPGDNLLRVPNQAQLDRALNEHNNAFLRRHERHFRKYLSAGRIQCVVVSTCVVAHVTSWRVSYNNARQSTVWAFPRLPASKHRLLRYLQDLVAS